MQTMLFLALAAAAAPLAAPPAGWTLLIGDESARTHYDPASVRAAGEGLVSVHTVTDLSEPVSNASRFDVVLLFNCRARTSAFLAARLYDPAGALIGSRETSAADAEFHAIEEVSVEARLHGVVCRERV